MHLVIGITDTEAYYHNYPLWIEAADPAITILTLRPDHEQDLEKCDGIILSGGVDTHPRFYGSTVLSYPNAPAQFHEQRDAFELGVFRFACQQNLPVLAICRGMQLVNIALGGDMVQDLEAAGKHNHRKINGQDGIHPVALMPGGLLHRICQSEMGTVNSAHHQGLGNIARELWVNAWSAEGVAEGIEWKDKTNQNFLLGVQWHPERLEQSIPGNLLGNGIRAAFLEAVRKHKNDITTLAI